MNSSAFHEAPHSTTLLAGELKATALQSAHRVADSLLQLDATDLVDIPDGMAGRALVNAYLGRSLGRSDLVDRSRCDLERSIEIIETTPTCAGLHSGFTGVAWVISHLGPTLPAFECSTLLEGIDETLIEYLEGYGDQGGYDLISGLVGFGIYGLERLPDPGGARILELCISQLVRRGVSRPSGVAWHTPPHHLPGPQRMLAPAGYFNLGMAHGLPGVLYVLARARKRGFLDDRGMTSLEGAVSWLLARRGNGGKSLAYPSWMESELDTSPRPGRLAWCYGDLGISSALLEAGTACHRDDWMAESLKLAQDCASAGFRNSQVVDHGLCHGAAGVAHTLLRLGRSLEDPVVLQGAEAWISRLLSMRCNVGIEGYASWEVIPAEGDGDKESYGFRACPGFLNGAGGVALVLAAAATDISPDWDRCLALS